MTWEWVGGTWVLWKGQCDLDKVKKKISASE